MAAASGVFRGSRSGEPGSECGFQGEAYGVGETGMHVNVLVWGFICAQSLRSLCISVGPLVKALSEEIKE